jgi:hypothetical protein
MAMPSSSAQVFADLESVMLAIIWARSFSVRVAFTAS